MNKQTALIRDQRGYLRDKASMCDGKQAHDSQETARKQAQKGMAKRGKRDQERKQKIRLNTYHCLFCDKWHVGYLPEDWITRKFKGN